MSRPVVLQSGEGREILARGTVIVFKATADTTAGVLSWMERQLPPHPARIPPPHVHKNGLEAFYILEGRVDFKLDSEAASCGPGSFVLVPAEVGHTFWNSGDDRARLLVIHSPALDGYFEALGRLWSGAEPPSTDEEIDLQRRFGMEPASSP